MQEALRLDFRDLQVLQVGVVDEEDLPRLLHVDDEFGLVVRRQDRRDAGFGVVDLLVIDHAAGRDDLLRLQRVAVHDDVLRRPVAAGDGELVFPALELRGLDRPRLDADLDRGDRGRRLHPEVDHVDEAVAADDEEIAPRGRDAADMDRIPGVDHRPDLVGAAVDQRDLPGIAQRHRHQVVDVDVVHLFLRTVLGLDEHLPAFLHLRHAPFRRRGRFEKDIAGHQVHFLFGQLARGAPVRHPRRRAVGDEALQVVVAVFTGDVGRQRLARRAFPQHPVAAGAALEVDLRALLEFLLRHHRVVGLAAGNLDLDLAQRGHRRLVGGGGTVRVFLGLLLRVKGRGQKPKCQRGAAQKGGPDCLGSGCHGISPFSW